tara:strand:+ start:303 stop:428 length:126 start_codon:yes stop_codon:yes gene_type:complete
MDTAHRRKDSTVRFVEAGEEGGGGGEVGGETKLHGANELRK